MWFAVAAVLLVLLGLAHSYLGERYILVRLFRRSGLPKLFGSETFTRRTLRFAWHLTTVAWFGFAALLLVLRSSPAASVRAQGQVLTVTFALSGLVALVGSRGRHPSWIVFLVVAGLVWLALA